jgi:putative membrane protein
MVVNLCRELIASRAPISDAADLLSRYNFREFSGRERNIMRLLLNWLLSAISLLIVSKVVHGFEVHGFAAALIAALVIGLINATLGFVLKLITLPLTVVTLGLFWLVINALMLMFASTLLKPDFVVHGFWPAFWGAIVLALINMVLKSLTREADRG